MRQVEESVLIETHYFPCIEFFALIKDFKQVHIEAHEHFVKQSYRNRCYILGANKVLLLTVPIHRGSGKISTQEVTIDYDQDWIGLHKKSIQSAYGNSPFYEFYANDFFKILNRKYQYLIDLNKEILTYCLKCLGLTDINIIFTEQFEKKSTKNISDYRDLIRIRTNQRNFIQEPYIQVFGKNFVPDLSVLDLLFCVGPNAIDVIRKSH